MTSPSFLLPSTTSITTAALPYGLYHFIATTKSLSGTGRSITALDDLDDVSNTSQEIILRSSLFPFSLQFHDASAPLLLWDINATDDVSLFLSHVRVDINVLCPDEQWAVCWPGEPAVDLPNQVQEDEQRTSEVELEKVVGVQVRAADRVQCDVELSDKADDVDEQTQPRAPDAPGGPEGELVQGMTVGFPVSGLVTMERGARSGSRLLTRPRGSECEPERFRRRRRG